MVRKLKDELDEVKINQSFNNCCSQYNAISPEIERITLAIDDLANSVSRTLVADAKGMETGLKEKCAEIKRLKLSIKKIIAPK